MGEPVIVFDTKKEEIEEAFILTEKGWNTYLDRVKRQEQVQDQKIPQPFTAQKLAVESTSIQEYTRKIGEVEGEQSQKSFGFLVVESFILLTFTMIVMKK